MNQVRRAFLLEADRRGWEPVSRGWPDYLCWYSERGQTRYAAVLLTSTSSRRLRRDQRNVATVLHYSQIPVLQYSLDNGLNPLIEASLNPIISNSHPDIWGVGGNLSDSRKDSF